MRVAVLGTGIMGAPMARNLRSAGHDVSAWNRSAEKAQPLAEDGVEVAGSIAEAVSGADVVITMLSDADAVEAVAGEALDALDGAVLAQMSTIGLDATERLARRAEEAGVPFVDAPVSGTKQPAEQGQLLVLASGPDDVRERVEPVFDAVGSKTVWLGGAGAGQRLKLVLNAWLLGMTEALAESIALAEALEVDPKQFLETIDGAPVGAPYAQLKGPMMIEREFPPAFPLALAAKDAGLVDEAARAAGLDLPLPRAIRDQMAKAVAAGHGDEDMAATIWAARPA
jgi:3-hydroxyisobutyrate dehydrogenase